MEGAAPDATASGSDRIVGHPNDVSTPLGSPSERHVADGAAPESRILCFDPRNSRAYLSADVYPGGLATLATASKSTLMALQSTLNTSRCRFLGVDYRSVRVSCTVVE